MVLRFACLLSALLFASLQPELAAAKGVRLRQMAIVFMLIVALAYLSDWPVSFWITSLSVAAYLAAAGREALPQRPHHA